jgi:hypothetical protein
VIKEGDHLKAPDLTPRPLSWTGQCRSTDDMEMLFAELESEPSYVEHSTGRLRRRSRRLDPDRARFGSRLPWLRAMTATGEPEPPARQLDGVSGRVRLACSDADRVFGTGAACRRLD